MDLERTLETQRARLLRLVTGWITVLGILSAGPLALPVPRWIRTFFETVLIRAEWAAQFCLRTSALMQANGDLIASVALPRLASQKAEVVPSTQALLRRMKTLRDVFENLPHHARRLMRVRRIVGEAFDIAAMPRVVVVRNCPATVSADWVAPRVERPPDKKTPLSWFARTPPALRAGGVYS